MCGQFGEVTIIIGLIINFLAFVSPLLTLRDTSTYGRYRPQGSHLLSDDENGQGYMHLWLYVIQYFLCSSYIAFEKENPTKISAPSISMSVVRVCVFRRGCQTYWLHLWKDGKWKNTQHYNWTESSIHTIMKGNFWNKIIKYWTKIVKSSFETFLALALALVEMH